MWKSIACLLRGLWLVSLVVPNQADETMNMFAALDTNRDGLIDELEWKEGASIIYRAIGSSSCLSADHHMAAISTDSRGDDINLLQVGANLAQQVEGDSAPLAAIGAKQKTESAESFLRQENMNLRSSESELQVQNRLLRKQNRKLKKKMQEGGTHRFQQKRSFGTSNRSEGPKYNAYEWGIDCNCNRLNRIDYESFGPNTMCRGNNWQAGGWPKKQAGDKHTSHSCSNWCNQERLCTAFDIRDGNCYLFKHNDVIGAYSQHGATCYRKKLTKYRSDAMVDESYQAVPAAHHTCRDTIETMGRTPADSMNVGHLYPACMSKDGHTENIIFQKPRVNFRTSDVTASEWAQRQPKRQCGMDGWPYDLCTKFYENYLCTTGGGFR